MAKANLWTIPDIIGTQGFAWSIISLHALILLFLIYRIRAWHAPVTTKHWDDVSFHGRAFFIPDSPIFALVLEATCWTLHISSRIIIVVEDSQENITKAIKAVHEEISKINFVEFLQQ